MIRYLNDAANNIEYTNSKGELIRRNPFDADFVEISQRLSLIHSNDAENRQRREHYEQDVKNAQVSIDAGRPPALMESLRTPPLHLNTPEDFELEVTEDTNWDPPLLATKPHVVSFPSSGIGPDAHPIVAEIAAMPHKAQSALASVLGILQEAGPALPTLIDLLQALFHHKASTDAAVK